MGEENRRNIENALNLIGVDPAFLIRESFLGYKFRKTNHKLYDNDQEIPVKLIRLYYGLNSKRASFDALQKAFVTHYIHQESKLEGIDTKSIHSKAEIEGLEVMYEYIHSDDIEYMFNIYTLKDLHSKLFSKAPYPDCAGEFRRHDVYLPGTGTELSEWSMIRPRLNELDPEVIRLAELGKNLKGKASLDDMLQFIDSCVELKCKIIKVHPFQDGNGRTTRGLINKLFENAGLPPIYIKENERTEYHKAMNKANNEGDYRDIKHFYKYKICDSIVELDINNRLKQEKNVQNLYENLAEEDKDSYKAVRVMLAESEEKAIREKIEHDQIRKMIEDMARVSEISSTAEKDIKIYQMKRDKKRETKD